jgi:hypothetical protein
MWDLGGQTGAGKRHWQPWGDQPPGRWGSRWYTCKESPPSGNKSCSIARTWQPKTRCVCLIIQKIQVQTKLVKARSLSAAATPMPR